MLCGMNHQLANHLLYEQAEQLFLEVFDHFWKRYWATDKKNFQ